MRTLKYLAIAIAALIYGAGSWFIWFYFVPVTVSLCDLARHRDWYNKRIVRVAASASGLYEGVIIADTGCDLSDSWAVVMIAKGYVPKPEVQAFIQPSFIGSEPPIRRANIVVIGRFDKNATMGCFGPEFGIRASSVELESEVVLEPFPRHIMMRQSQAAGDPADTDGP